MHLGTLIFGIILLPKAFSLKCYECSGIEEGNCTVYKKECPSQEYQCSAMRVVSYIGDSKMPDLHIKSCALPAECVQSSLNFGISSSAVTSKCCSSELCNTQPAPDPSSSSPNGKKCYSCAGLTCTTTLKCNGNEDHCVSGTVKIAGIKTHIKGCASQLMCSGATAAQLEQSTGLKLSCCQGDLCNGASSTSVGFLLLVAPLLSVVFIS